MFDMGPQYSFKDPPQYSREDTLWLLKINWPLFSFLFVFYLVSVWYVPMWLFIPWYVAVLADSIVYHRKATKEVN